MSKDNTMFIEMYGDIDLTAPVLPEQLPDIAFSDPAVSGAANSLIRKLAYRDLVEKLLGDVPVPERASLPTEVGALSSARTNTGTVPGTRPKDSGRRQKLRHLVMDAGVSINAYNEETISSLLDSMEAYISNSIKLSSRLRKNGLRDLGSLQSQ